MGTPTVADFAGRDIISTRDLTKDEILFLLDLAEQFEDPSPSVLQGKIMASLFFEPSTRTRLSFESAMLRLGGRTLGFAEAGVSSAAKGESLADTIRVAEGYADAIVIRHPREGAARAAAEAASIPVINAGDGANQHPTQTLLDLFTLRKEKGELEGLRVGFLGDLKFGRAVRSLINTLGRFNAQMTFISPPSLRLPNYYLEELTEQAINWKMATDVFPACRDLEALYVTRIQRERFPDPLEFERVKNVYQLDRSFLDEAPDDIAILHPLPRVNEISPDLDPFPQSVYFQQAHNGVTIRKALLASVLGALS
jgi:aspartate carbamoyltransferase catalytic subunit